LKCATVGWTLLFPYNDPMKITYDPQKDSINQQKHGISLADAVLLEWDTLWTFPDERFDYLECRMVGYAYIGLRLHCFVYTDRHDERRIISLRKANKRELKLYAQA